MRFTAVPSLKLAVGRRAAPGAGTLPIALLLAALAALALALAKPQRTVAVPIEQASIMLVTDHSRSMEATDVDARPAGARRRRAAHTFLDAAAERRCASASSRSRRARRRADADDATTTPCSA